MQDYRILIPIIFFSVFIFVIVSAILYHKKVRAVIVKGTENLGRKDLTDTDVNNYIAGLKSMKYFPNELHYWNTCRAGWQLVKANNNISDSVKEELKITLLSKGVNGIK